MPRAEVCRKYNLGTQRGGGSLGSHLSASVDDTHVDLELGTG